MRAAAAHAIGAGAQRCGAVCRWNWRCPSTCLDRWVPCCEHVVNTHLNQLRPGCNHRRTKEVLGFLRGPTIPYCLLSGTSGFPRSARTPVHGMQYTFQTHIPLAAAIPGSLTCPPRVSGSGSGLLRVSRSGRSGRQRARRGRVCAPPETPRRVGADSLAPLDREPQAEQQSSAREVSRWWVRWSAAGGRADHAQRRRRTAAAPHTHL